MAVVIETTIGDFTIDLYTQERPQTCRNFLKLCKLKYYNWNLFFTVQNNFIAQTGDPTSTGKGGESVYGIILGEKARYYEAEKLPKIKHDKVGLVSMVNCGNKMLGSQFFITLAPDLQSLDGEHCVFGEISEGFEIILKLNEAICDSEHRPYQDIRISHTVILEDPYEDPEGLIVPDRSPGPTKEVLMSDRIGADEEIDDTEGLTLEQIEEINKEKEAKARATILEIVGDIPDADIAPPENVLFVCKLNPVTSDDDLEIIFSRFGKIIGCEVIRDKQSGDSLQYAFIEFADQKSCEEAYFKMDNVLIDDRRIHVDFSQSVAKMRWRGKGKGIKYFTDEEQQKNFRKQDGKPTDRRRSRSRSPKRNNYKDRREKNNTHRRVSRSSSCGSSVERRSRSRSKDRHSSRRNDNKEKRLREKCDIKSRKNECKSDRRNKSRSRSRHRSKNKYEEKRSRSNERRNSYKKDHRDLMEDKKSVHKSEERNHKKQRKTRERSKERESRYKHKKSKDKH